MSRPIRVLLLLAMVISLACSAAAIDFREADNPDLIAPLPLDVYLLDWVALGTFPIEPAVEGKPAPASWSEDHFDVSEIRVLSGEFAGKRWQKLKHDPDAKFRLDKPFPETLNAAVYLGTYVFAEKAGERKLLVGSDDGITLWINGSRVFDKQLSRECKADQDAVSVRLHAGMNTIVARITQGAGGWEFVARFADNTGLATSSRPFASRAQKLPNVGDIFYANPNLLAGPYIQNVTTDSTTIMWYTAHPSLGKLTVSDGKNSYSYETRAGRRVSEVIVSDLTPGAAYTYNLDLMNTAGKSVQKIDGDDYRFKTFPNKSQPITFIAYGDTRTNPDRHAAVIDGMAREDADFVLMTGDLVGHGTELRLWPTEFFGPADKLMRRVPFFIVLGNHEANAQYYFDLLSLPMGERYYSFDYLDAHIIGLDSCTQFGPGSEQYKWLIDDLEKHKDAKWKFVFLHHPTYTSSAHGSIGEDGRPKEWAIRLGQDIFPDLAAKYGIHAFFSGHDHTYERGQRDGAYYIVTGGGGAPNYGDAGADRNPYRQHFYSGLHYCVITLDGDKGKMVVKKPDGKVIDEADF